MNKKGIILIIIIVILAAINIERVEGCYCVYGKCSGLNCASGASCPGCPEQKSCGTCTTCSTTSCSKSCSSGWGHCNKDPAPCGPNCDKTSSECDCDSAPFHFKCVGSDCKLVGGSGSDKCTKNSQCGGSSCFLAGTPIALSDSTEKPIEDIKVGDVVLSYDLNANKKVNAKVLELESPVREGYYTIKFEDGSKLKVTNEHPIYIKNSVYQGWGSIIPKITLDDTGMVVNKINIGDYVLKLNNKWVRIINIIHIKERVQTYNLKKVSKTNTFFAGDVLVHNKGTTSTTTSSGCGSFAIGAHACQGSSCVICTSSGWTPGSFAGCCGSTCCRTVNAYCGGTYCGGGSPNNNTNNSCYNNNTNNSCYNNNTNNSCYNSIYNHNNS